MSNPDAAPAPATKVGVDVTKTNRRFPCTDGTTVVLSFMPAYTLARHGVRKIRVVVANGKRYLYVKFPGESEQSLIRWLVLDYFEKMLAGDGRIHHDGSDRYLLENFSREQFERLTAEPTEREPRTRQRTPNPGVTPEMIEKQMTWLTEPKLQKLMVKLLASFTNPTEADDLRQDVFLKLRDQIKNGQCKAVDTDPKVFKNYVRTVCRNKALDTLESWRKNKAISMAGHEDSIAEDVDVVPARSTPVRDSERDYNETV